MRATDSRLLTQIVVGIVAWFVAFTVLLFLVAILGGWIGPGEMLIMVAVSTVVAIVAVRRLVAR